MTRTRYMTAVLVAGLALAGLLPAGTARAQEGLGVGVIAGEPTGVCMKAWLSRTTAFSAAAAWSWSGEEALELHGDYLIHNYNTFPVQTGALPFYYGVGARLKLNDRDPAVGIRVPLGVSYLFATRPLDLFLEVAPILDITPGTVVKMSAALGVRYTLR